jgi:hypothetical protein
MTFCVRDRRGNPIFGFFQKKIGTIARAFWQRPNKNEQKK